MNIVISGATKGIGRAIAEKFAQEGFNLFICSRSQEDLDDCQTSLKKINPGIAVFPKVTDVRQKDEVSAFAAYVHAKVDRLDVLVNNAGVFIPGQICQEAEGTLEKLIETNLYSAYYLTRALLPLMLPQKSGHIFNMCSIASLFAFPDGGSYSISKFAMLGFSKVLRQELKQQGIKVTSLLPGATWSNAWSGANFPVNRLMQATDIAQIVWNAYQLGPSAVVEEILIRPQLGDL